MYGHNKFKNTKFTLLDPKILNLPVFEIERNLLAEFKNTKFTISDPKIYQILKL